MRVRARLSESAPVLADRARTFGAFGPRGGQPGTLVLTAERIQFSPADGAAGVDIPLDDVERVGSGTSFGGPAEGRSVLKIVYHRNLIFGVVVDRPDRWINALDALARGRRRALVVERAEPGPDPARFRIVTALMLLVVVTLGILLPLFFSWVQARVNHRVVPAATVAAPSTTAP